MCRAKFKSKENLAEEVFEQMIRPLGVPFSRCDRQVVAPLELDFYFPSLGCAVEINGPVHYKPIYGEKRLDTVRRNDRRKRRRCRRLGITLWSLKLEKGGQSYYMKRFVNVIRRIEERAGIS